MESRKMGLVNLFSGQQWRNRHREQTYGHGVGVGEEGEGESMKRVTWKLTIPYGKQIANGNLLYDSGNSNRGPVTIQKVGWGGRWEREDMGVPMADS